MRKEAKKSLREYEIRGQLTSFFDALAAESGLVESIVEKCGIGAYFRGIFVSSDIGYRKPHERFARSVLETLNAEGRDCVMIGDRLPAVMCPHVLLPPSPDGRRGIGNQPPCELEPRKDPQGGTLPILFSTVGMILSSRTKSRGVVGRASSGFTERMSRHSAVPRTPDARRNARPVPRVSGRCPRPRIRNPQAAP